jgi:hypothetical protein
MCDNLDKTLTNLESVNNGCVVSPLPPDNAFASYMTDGINPSPETI